MGGTVNVGGLRVSGSGAMQSRKISKADISDILLRKLGTVGPLLEPSLWKREDATWEGSPRKK